MKLLFFILSLRGGGAEGALVNLANNLDKSKHDVTVLSLFNKGINIKKLNKDVKYKYVFSRYIPGYRILLSLLPPNLLFKLMIKDKHDIIISYLQGVTSRIVAGAPDGQIIVTRIGCTFYKNADSSKAYKSRKEMINCYKRFNKIIGVSEDALDSFSKVTGVTTNIEVLYNIYDTDMIFKKSSEQADFIKDKNTINFITTGSLTKVKGIMRLLECFKKLLDDGFLFHFYIIGNGEEREALEGYANNYLKENVTFLGFQKNPYKYVYQANMYICSSYNEGFSNALAEAMILGVPVITTDCAGMKEMIGWNNEYGIIVENSNEGLYNGLKNVLEDKSILPLYKEKVIKRKDFFLTENGIKRTEELFNSLVSKKK